MRQYTPTSKMGRVIVIGVDGATFTLLEPMMEQGKLPNLKAFKDYGSMGVLKTVFPPVTPAAWSTFMTGKNPGKHGILEFVVKSKDGETPTNSRLRKGKTLWKILSEAGKRSIVLNVPTTYPPENINGEMISCFFTPKGNTDFTHPPELLDEITSRFGDYRLYITQVYSKGHVQDVLDNAYESMDYKMKVSRYMRDSREWDFFMTHIFATDRVQHELWHLIDPLHPLYNAKEAASHAHKFYDFFSKVDEHIGDFMSGLKSDDTVFIISDHGMGTAHKFLNLNVWMLENGFMHLNSGPATLLKRAAFNMGITPRLGLIIVTKLGLGNMRLNQGVSARKRTFSLINRLFLSLNNVDWARTKAFAKGYYGQIFINLKGREPHGSVDKSDYERVCEDIIGALRETVDPETGEKIIGPVMRREEIYSGPFVEYAPDISFLPSDMKYKAIGTLDFTSNHFIDKAYANSGDHRLEGVLFAKGPFIRKNARIDQKWIGDLAPTILHTYGIPVPDDMDGKVIEDLFEDGYMKDNPIKIMHIKPDPNTAIPDSGYSEEEKDKVKKRLKDLGYL